MMNPKIVVVAGTLSNTGKTTLLCDLLRELAPHEPWEAIKLTRGHYRSCGKDPHACCVSDLLGAEPTVRSGREETYAFGKDTGRYWDAGASNVHWVIATDSQVEQGIRQALARVKSAGVLIEGTSLLKYIQPDFAVMAAGGEQKQIKPSARRALMEGKIDAVYVLPIDSNGANLTPAFAELARDLPVYHAGTQQRLVEQIRNALTGPGALRSRVSDLQTQSVL
ncbi:MAG: hypothetical protein ACREEM_20745 [Blastocatellia bacterium]